MDNQGIATYKNFILQKSAELCAGITAAHFVTVVGSRVREDFTADSDFDVVIVVDTLGPLPRQVQVVEGGKTLNFIFQRLQNFNEVAGFKLSYYRLATEELVVGPDDSAYLAWRASRWL